MKYEWESEIHDFVKRMDERCLIASVLVSARRADDTLDVGLTTTRRAQKLCLKQQNYRPLLEHAAVNEIARLDADDLVHITKLMQAMRRKKREAIDGDD